MPTNSSKSGRSDDYELVDVLIELQAIREHLEDARLAGLRNDARRTARWTGWTVVILAVLVIGQFVVFTALT